MTRWPSAHERLGQRGRDVGQPAGLHERAPSPTSTKATCRRSFSASVSGKRDQASTRPPTISSYPAACRAASDSTSCAPASVERLLRVDRSRARATSSSRSARARARSRSRSRRARARVVAVELDARARRAAARARARQRRRSSTATRSRSTCARWSRRAARLVGNLPYYVSSPLLRRFLDAARPRARRARDAAGGGRAPHRVAARARRSTASCPCSTALCGRRRRSPLRFPPGRLRAARRRSPPPCCAPASSTSRGADVADLAAFETLRPDGLRPTAEEPLKTTCKIAILTSRNT